MPSWKIHAQVANKLNSKLNYYEDKDKFLLGNILPDMYGGHVVKNVSKIIEYQVSHYREYTIINGGKFCLPDYETFKNVHLDDIQDPLILGYLVHLMTDYYFNKYTYTNKVLLDNSGEVCGIKTKRNEILECNRNTMIRIKQEDFNSFEKVLNIDNVSIAYTSNILDSLSKLKTFEVEQKDIIKVINYFNSLSASADNNVKVPLILYSKEMLNEMIDDCVNFIFEYITSTIIKGS